MNYAKAIEPVTTLESEAAELVRRVRESGQPIIITQNGNATAVLQDVERYERQRRALLLFKYLAKGDRDYRQGRVLSASEADRHFRTHLADLEPGDSEKRRERGRLARIRSSETVAAGNGVSEVVRVSPQRGDGV